MAWTTPITWTTGQVVTAAQLNTHIRDNETFLRTAHVARMYQAAALSNLNTTIQLVTWDTVDYDSDSLASIASDWFVIPTGFDGTYRISGLITFVGSVTGGRQVLVKKNETYTVRAPNGVGTALVSGPTVQGAAAANGLTPMWQGPLAAGDHVTVETWQSSGGTLSYSVGKDTMAIEIQYIGS